MTRHPQAFVLLVGLFMALSSSRISVAAQATETKSGGLSESGNQWLARCGSVVKGQPPNVNDAFAVGVCMGWVDGIRATGILLRDSLDKEDAICEPPGVTLGQALKVIATYLEGHPAELHKPVVFLTYLAFQEAFPCIETPCQ